MQMTTWESILLAIMVFALFNYLHRLSRDVTSLHQKLDDIKDRMINDRGVSYGTATEGSLESIWERLGTIEERLRAIPRM